MSDETWFRIPSPVAGLSLALCRQPAAGVSAGDGQRPVLYVHGATFPSSLSIAYRFAGGSWRDALNRVGFDVWGLDFLGYGRSDRYPEMAGPPDAAPPLGTAELASRQIEVAVRFIRERTGAVPSIVAHSWGTLATGCFAARCPELVDRLALFGPIAPRTGIAPATPQPAWREVTLDDQWARFVADVPAGAAAVLDRGAFETWGQRYLDSDPGARSRRPPAVRVPAGPASDIAAAWSGRLPYDPGQIRAPVAILRGEWDSLTTDDDARTLFDGFTAAPIKRDVKLGHGTHLMHLESGRFALHRETEAFLSGQDAMPGPTI